jgi:hypothetical protein
MDLLAVGIAVAGPRPDAVQSCADVAEHWCGVGVERERLHVARNAHGEPRAAGARVVSHQVYEASGEGFHPRRLGVGDFHVSELLQKTLGGQMITIIILINNK